MYPYHVFIINTILLIIIIISRKTSTGEQRPLGCHNEQRLPPQLVSRRFHQSTECARLFNASSSSSWSPFKEFSTPMVICSANDVAANCHFYLRNLRTMSVTLANYCIQNSIAQRKHKSFYIAHQWWKCRIIQTSHLLFVV